MSAKSLLVKSLVVLGSVGLLAGVGATAASAAANPGSMAARVSFEVDNGSAWKLDAKPTTMTGTYNEYADAGIVYDLGKAKDFTGITYSGTGQLGANVWLGDGSQAYTPGEHLFASGPVNFSYGPLGQTFWAGPQTGQPVTVDYIQTLGDVEVYAWVGISGNAPQSGHVDAIPGVHQAANLTLTVNGDQVTAEAR